MPRCHTCGEFVTADFARVFGSNENDVYACPECSTFVEIADMGAAGGASGGVRTAVA